MSIDPSSEREATVNARTECQRINFGFISGRYGKESVAAFTSMIANFDDKAWRRSRISESDILDNAVLATIPMVGKFLF